MLLLLAGCASAPTTRSLPTPQIDPPPPVAVARDEQWDGSGGSPAMKNRGEALAELALRMRGTRYRYGGATRDGFDCSGLVFYAHQQLGLTVPRTSRDQSEAAHGVKPRKLRRGDLVFFRIDSRRVNHVGIYIGDHKFVHAPGAGKPVTINSLDDEFYAETFAWAGRYWDTPP